MSRPPRSLATGGKSSHIGLIGARHFRPCREITRHILGNDHGFLDSLPWFGICLYGQCPLQLRVMRPRSSALDPPDREWHRKGSVRAYPHGTIGNCLVALGKTPNSVRPIMKIADSPPPRVLTKRQAAKSLQVCERTITSLVLSGKLRVVRFGRNVRIDPADLEAFIASAKVGGSPQL